MSQGLKGITKIYERDEEDNGVKIRKQEQYVFTFVLDLWLGHCERLS